MGKDIKKVYQNNVVKKMYYRTTKKRWLYPILYVIGLFFLLHFMKYYTFDLVESLAIIAAYFYLITR